MSRPPSVWKGFVDVYRGRGKFRTSMLRPGNGPGGRVAGVGVWRSRNLTCRGASAVRVQAIQYG